jgi:hypothetical protein
MIWAPGSIWKVFKVVRARFEKFVQGRFLGGSNRPLGSQIPEGQSNWPR